MLVRKRVGAAVFIAGIILFSAAALLGGFVTSPTWPLGPRALAALTRCPARR